ncbi:hypothetical protein J5N97_014913 [Dioscorea zingiberensis]|uniref:Uncharacterized protein n=1 Tax=Dioscorea zingiberensis TaxID=325984 RepID=A0A9D5CV01_9LILI|nr:hypothetical protein J5N97_014913 [Dioscorea zingiberensis]
MLAPMVMAINVRSKGASLVMMIFLFLQIAVYWQCSNMGRVLLVASYGILGTYLKYRGAANTALLPMSAANSELLPLSTPPAMSTETPTVGWAEWAESYMKSLIKRVDHYKNLVGHRGIIHSVRFNDSGQFIISASDDKNVIIWDWARGTQKFVYPTGHEEKVLDAQILPFTGDCSIISSSVDGQAETLRDTFPASDKSLGRLLAEVPYLLDGVLKLLESLCSPENNEKNDKDFQSGDRVTPRSKYCVESNIAEAFQSG